VKSRILLAYHNPSRRPQRRDPRGRRCDSRRVYWLSITRSGTNYSVINRHDMGREIQLSFYAGPNPYNPDDKCNTTWGVWPWNPMFVYFTRSDGKCMQASFLLDPFCAEAPVTLWEMQARFFLLKIQPRKPLSQQCRSSGAFFAWTPRITETHCVFTGLAKTCHVNASLFR